MDSHLIGQGEVSAFEIPTPKPESDGTLEWSATTLVLVRLEAGGFHALGYSYADRATATLIRDKLLPQLAGENPMDIPRLHGQLSASLRNLGQTAISAMALSAVDNALWDLKAKLLGLPVVSLLGGVRADIFAYASGGFTSQTLAELAEQVAQWREQGFRAVKIKVGRKPRDDEARVKTARDALGKDAELYVDANGAYSVKQALQFAEIFAAHGVTWFEEPVRSTHLDGLQTLVARAPAGMAITTGEYGWDGYYFQRLLEARAVDVMQADITRCGGVSGFMQAAALSKAYDVPLSSHCAPALHAHCCCAATNAVSLEYFHDHYRIENMLFAGAPRVREGTIAPDRQQRGFGLEFKSADAERFRVY